MFKELIKAALAKGYTPQVSFFEDVAYQGHNFDKIIEAIEGFYECEVHFFDIDDTGLGWIFVIPSEDDGQEIFASTGWASDWIRGYQA